MQPTSDLSWHAFYTKPRHEKKATERLTEQGFEVYCPIIKTKVRWSDRWKKVDKPLITGYIFARVEPENREKLLQDPGVLHCLFWRGKPAIVRNEEIESLRIIEQYGTDAEVKSLKPGDQAVISEGAMAGQHGIVIHSSKEEATIRLDSLKLQITVKISTRKLDVLR
ncbi:MAG: UpxY family transcription antiterminator [Balneolaceae bacterium]